MSENNRESCPCCHTTPCHPHCTCVASHSSHGCRRCCSYGGKEQQQERARHLVRIEQMAEASKDLLAALKSVAAEIRNRCPDVNHPTWNPDAHVEITLSIEECRTILAVLNKAKAK